MLGASQLNSVSLIRSPVGLNPGASVKEILRLRQRPPIILRLEISGERDLFFLIDQLMPQERDF